MIVRSCREEAAERIITVLPLLHRTILHPANASGSRQAMEYRVLRLLSQHGELPMSGISRRLFISKPYLTAIVDSLIADGHVERRRDVDDRRVVRIVVTERGTQHLAQGIGIVRERLLGHLAALDEDEVVLLSESLENLARVLARVGEGEERPP